MTLYLIDKSDTIHRLPMEADLQAEVHLLLQNQYLDFIKDAEFTDFQGSYTAQPGELYELLNYAFPEELNFAIDNASNIDILDLQTSVIPKALMADIEIDREKIIIFQKLDARQVLEPSFSFTQSGEVFTKVEDRVLTLNKKIDAAYIGDKLIFYSFSKVRPILPILDHYEEATKADIDKFIEVEHFAFTDEEKFRKGLSPLTRKKIRMIQDNQVIELSSVKKIKKQAKKHKIEIKYNDQDQVVFPKEISKCKKLISFLNEEYAVAILTKRNIKMNSKKYLK